MGIMGNGCFNTRDQSMILKDFANLAHFIICGVQRVLVPGVIGVDHGSNASRIHIGGRTDAPCRPIVESIQQEQRYR